MVVFDQRGWSNCWIGEVDWWEWGEKGNEEKRVRWVKGRERREKKIKKSITRWTVNVHICTVTVHLYGHDVYLHIFTNWILFGLECIKLVLFSILEDYRWADVFALIHANLPLYLYLLKITQSNEVTCILGDNFSLTNITSK